MDQDDEIVVRRGDTLWSLAERHLAPAATNAEIAQEWPDWFAANRKVIGKDPDHLVPGERLRPPERSTSSGRHRAGGSTGNETAARPGASSGQYPDTGVDAKAGAGIRGAR